VRGASSGTRVTYPMAAVAGAVGVALGIAAFVSPFASSLPDGLEHAAERLGFAHRAVAPWTTPFPDYAMPFVQSAGAATAVAGVLGTIATAALGWFISRGLQSSRHPEP